MLMLSQGIYGQENNFGLKVLMIMLLLSEEINLKNVV
jgi:hypothetical protein